MVKFVSTPRLHDIVVDIRHPDEITSKPLTIKLATSQLQIPFYQIQQLLEQLDTTKRYLLYCEQGSMSRLQAELMAEKGIDNIHVLVT